MNILTLEGRILEFTEKRLLSASRQLGAYEALLDYALKGLRGTTASEPYEVANFISQRIEDIKAEEKSELKK